MTSTHDPLTPMQAAEAPAVNGRRRIIGDVAGFGGAALMLLSAGTTWLGASTISGAGFTLSRLPSFDAWKVPARYVLDGEHLVDGGVSIGNVLVLLAVVTVLATLVPRLRMLALVSAAGCLVLAGAFVFQVSKHVDTLRTKGAHTTLLGFVGTGVYLAVGGAILACVAFVFLRTRPAARAPLVETNPTG